MFIDYSGFATTKMGQLELWTIISCGRSIVELWTLERVQSSELCMRRRIHVIWYSAEQTLSQSQERVHSSRGVSTETGQQLAYKHRELFFGSLLTLLGLFAADVCSKKTRQQICFAQWSSTSCKLPITCILLLMWHVSSSSVELNIVQTTDDILRQ
jgi:hypothetical protein